jgi:hypothetical protein
MGEALTSQLAFKMSYSDSYYSVLGGHIVVVRKHTGFLGQKRIG